MTGLCVVDEVGVAFHKVIEREDEKWNDYLDDIATVLYGLGAPTAAGIEEVKPPKAFIRGKQRIFNPKPQIETARVYGFVECWLRHYGFTFVPVKPGGNGSGDLSSYPPQIVGPGERTGTGGKLNHARSAYDVALVAASQLGIKVRKYDPIVHEVETAASMFAGGHRFEPIRLPDANADLSLTPEEKQEALEKLRGVREETGR